MEVKHNKLPFGILHAQMRTRSMSIGYTVGDRLHAFFCFLILHYRATNELKVFVRTFLLVGQMDNFK